MCGIAGCWDQRAATAGHVLEDLAGRMADALVHRGPDDRGVWADPAAGLGLGFRRLAIVDLTAEGHQPMPSADGRWVIVFNGEVYNHRALRAELEALGHRFRGHSDTEVMLEAMSAWGVEAAVRRFNGIFAFAAWDRRERRLHLVRDRHGVKPLYYGWAGATLLFGSELKALRAHPAFTRRVDRGALALLLHYGYVESPYAIDEGVRKLTPGSVLTVSADSTAATAGPRAYWSGRAVAETPAPPPVTDPAEALAELDRLLRDAIGLQMMADVPVGAFLSGGVDSSLVVALMQAQSARPVRTFTIGFAEAAFDEAAQARAVAKHLGTDHTELTLSAAEARAVVPLLPRLYDEPLADVSQIPTYLVSQLARRQVTVSLSGDGGDEQFGGYAKYAWARRTWGTAGRIPRPLRRLAAGVLTAWSADTWDRVLHALGPLLPRGVTAGAPGGRVHKFARMLGGASPRAAYRDLSALWPDPGRIVVDGAEPANLLGGPDAGPGGPGFVAWMMTTDMLGYMTDDVLAKVDRASMGVSLEARVPLLDHRITEFAWRMPVALRMRGPGKWPLRELLYRHVPRALVDRPKQGFSVPMAAWLRGPLRGWAEDLLSAERLRREGFLQPAPVREVWAQHLAGTHDWQHRLWPVLSFQAWLADQ